MQALESHPTAPNYEDYLKELVGRQHFRVMNLYEKAQDIISTMGIEDKKCNFVIATMYRGEDRYRIVQEKDKRWAPIYILKGGTEQIQKVIKTDLEECGDPREATEVAMLAPNGSNMSGTRIEGKTLDIGKKYVLDLPEAILAVSPILNLWDPVLESRNQWC